LILSLVALLVSLAAVVEFATTGTVDMGTLPEQISVIISVAVIAIDTIFGGST
jgi:small basic protein